MNHKYQLLMLVQNMTQVKPRSPAITQRLLEHDLTRLSGLTISCISSVVNMLVLVKCYDIKMVKLPGGFFL